MTIKSVVLHVQDLDVTTAFYRDFLGGRITSQGDDYKVLDFVTGTIELRELSAGEPSAWQDDDTTRGFRHIGLKVDDVGAYAERLEAAGIAFRLRPYHVPILDVLITFFFDPDGTVVELVESHLQYPIVNSADAISAEHRMPVPERPRLDHVGHTITDRLAAEALYAPLGFENVGAIEWKDDRGYRIDWLRHNDTVLEVFTFTAPTAPPTIDLERYGFAAVDMAANLDSADRRRLPDGRLVAIDPDGLPVLVQDQ